MVKDCDWHDLEPWYNDRILDTFISSDEVDLHGDHISPEIFEKILPWFQKYGYYEWQHEGIVIGKILGWRFQDGKPQIRVGIHDSTSSNIPLHDEVWTKIKSMGLRGMSSIKGIANDQKPTWDGTTQINDITDIGMWGVGWVGDDAANTGANVTFVEEMAKGMIAKSKEAHNRIIESLTHSPKNELQTLMKEYQEIEKEVTTMTEKIDTKKQLDDLQLKVKSLLGKLEKAEEPPVGDAPPGEEEPKDEGNQDTVAALAADIDKLATAIEALEPGTPEAVAEAVTIAAEVKQGAPDEPDATVEMKKALETLTKKLTDMNALYEKHMSAPLTKTAKTPVKPTVQVDGTDSIESITNAFQKGKGEQNKIWKKYGFNRMK